MKKIVLAFLAISAAVFAWTYYGSSTPVVATQDYNNCIKKVNSEWGTRCRDCPVYKDSYKIYLVNECEETLDLMCCVQKQYKNWRCFYRKDMAPKDTLEAYACSGTGKFLKWTRKTGDDAIVFPTEAEVNATYSK